MTGSEHCVEKRLGMFCYSVQIVHLLHLQINSENLLILKYPPLLSRSSDLPVVSLSKAYKTGHEIVVSASVCVHKLHEFSAVAKLKARSEGKAMLFQNKSSSDWKRSIHWVHTPLVRTSKYSIFISVENYRNWRSPTLNCSNLQDKLWGIT